MTMPLQKIYFGPPGSGKSHKAFKEAKEKVGVQPDDKSHPSIITTVFHPETTYGDFTAKLLPMSDDRGSVKYEVHAGPFVQALALALNDLDKPVVLIIDEINRGPCAAIFGDLFQLLDRGDQGHSQYEINVPTLFVQALKRQGIEKIVGSKDESEAALFNPVSGRLRLPANLHLLGTMNTSDESVFSMDAAFKRRWQWDFVAWNADMTDEEKERPVRIGSGNKDWGWGELLEKMNEWIGKAAYGSSIDDKLIGGHFVRLLPPLRKFELAQGNSFIDQVQPLRYYAKFCINCIENSNMQKHLSQIAANLPINSTDLKAWEEFRKINGFGTITDSSSPTYRGHKFKAAIENLEKELIKLAGVEMAERIKRTLPHHLWDNVFARDRTPIADLINMSKPEAEVRTYGQFLKEWETFLGQIMKLPSPPK